jgi:hypothetical protein
VILACVTWFFYRCSVIADTQVLGLFSYPQELPFYSTTKRREFFGKTKATKGLSLLVVTGRRDQTHDLPLRRRTLYHSATRERERVGLPDKVHSPGLVVGPARLPYQRPVSCHVVIVLHPGRGAPRTAKYGHLSRVQA